MKIKIYIVTYNNAEDINNNLRMLLDSDLSGHEVEINVINNHSNLHIKEEYLERINILHNTLRPDFSTGHLSRNWNQAIINGFKDLNEPDCDILIHTQDDVVWSKDWLKHTIEVHKKYTFFSGQVGDAFCSYTAEGVKNIGLWDERFCNIMYQEFDYFLRALLYNREKSSINSYVYMPVTGERKIDLLLNPIEDIEKKFPRRPDRNLEREAAHTKSGRWIKQSKLLFREKWGIQHPRPVFQDNAKIGKPSVKNFIYYPYFEKDIYELDKKNYVADLSKK